MRTAILLYPGVSGHEALAALAALQAAGLTGELVAHEALVLTQEGARLVPERLGYATIEAAPAVVLPAGGSEAALLDAPLARALRARRGRWTLASGDAVRLAAAAGLADDRRVAVPPGASAPPGTRAAHARLVEDGRLLTCTGGDALVDLVLHHAAREVGEAAARRAAETLGREYRVFALGAAEP